VLREENLKLVEQFESFRSSTCSLVG
jgi:hypothetical protein